MYETDAATIVGSTNKAHVTSCFLVADISKVFLSCNCNAKTDILTVACDTSLLACNGKVANRQPKHPNRLALAHAALHCQKHMQ